MNKTYLIYCGIQPLPVDLVIKQIVGETILCVILGIIVAHLNKPADTSLQSCKISPK